MGGTFFFFKYIKVYLSLLTSNCFFPRNVLLRHLSQVKVEKGFRKQPCFNTYTKDNEIKNKDRNRIKKQKLWLNKINEIRAPPKKFGNKLGTLAKLEYLKYEKEHKRKKEVKNFNKYTNEMNIKDNTSATIICINDAHNLNEDIFEEKETFYDRTEDASKNRNHLLSLPKKNTNSINSFNEKANTLNESIHEKNSLSIVTNFFWDDVYNELKYHLPFLQPYSITMALNCLSKINYNYYYIFKLVAEHIDERWIKNFNIKDLTLLLLSYSRINFKFYPFINLISREILYKIGYAGFEEIAHIAYAYTKMKIYDYEVFLHLAKETMYKIKENMCKDVYNSECEKNKHIENKKIQDKEYANLCLFLYCLGKMKHCDMELFHMSVQYIKINQLNNIDLSNLAYTYSTNNIYEKYFYEKFALISVKRLDSLEPMQKIMIVSYLFKFPSEQFLSMYKIFLENITKEMEKISIYKESLFLNACINSFSNNVFLDFLFEITKQKMCENQMNEIKILISLLTLIIDYSFFFIKYKKTLFSKDYPQIMNIFIKTYVYVQTNITLFPTLKIDTHTLENQISIFLDKIIVEAKKMHSTDLLRIRNIVNEKVINDKWPDKMEAICHLLNSSKN